MSWKISKFPLFWIPSLNYVHGEVFERKPGFVRYDGHGLCPLTNETISQRPNWSLLYNKSNKFADPYGLFVKKQLNKYPGHCSIDIVWRISLDFYLRECPPPTLSVVWGSLRFRTTPGQGKSSFFQSRSICFRFSWPSQRLSWKDG